MDAFLSAVATNLSGNPWALITLVFVAGIFYIIKDLTSKLDPNKLADAIAKAHGDSLSDVQKSIATLRVEVATRESQLEIQRTVDNLAARVERLEGDVEKISCTNAITCPTRNVPKGPAA